MEEKKQAVLYLRYSSSNQSEQSIEGQRRVCAEFAGRNGYEIIKEYADRALTWKTDNRPDFLKMVSEAKNGVFKYIIVYKLDRFSRNKYDSVIYKHKLKEYGVKVVSATEQISDSIEGKDSCMKINLKILDKAKKFLTLSVVVLGCAVCLNLLTACQTTDKKSLILIRVIFPTLSFFTILLKTRRRSYTMRLLKIILCLI